MYDAIADLMSNGRTSRLRGLRGRQIAEGQAWALLSARSRRVTVLPPDTEARRLKSPTDVCVCILGCRAEQVLGDTINQVRCGLMDSRIATTVGYLAGILLRGMEHGQLDDRLTRIEAQLGIIDSTRREIIPNATAKSNGPN